MPGIFRSTRRIDQGASSMALSAVEPVGGRPDRVAVLLEPARERLADDLLVIDQQDPRAFLAHGGLRSRRRSRGRGPGTSRRGPAASASTSLRLEERAIAQRAFRQCRSPNVCPSSCTASVRGARRAGRLAGEPRADQAGRRDDRRAALELRLAEDERQDRDEEVRVRHAQDARGPLGPPRREPQERPMRGVLVAALVERVVGARPRELEPGRSPKHLLDVRAHAFQEPCVGIARPDPPQGDLAHVAAAAAGPRRPRRAGGGSSSSFPARRGSPPASSRRASRRCRRRPRGRGPSPSPSS